MGRAVKPSAVWFEGFILKQWRDGELWTWSRASSKRAAKALARREGPGIYEIQKVRTGLFVWWAVGQPERYEVSSSASGL